MSHDTLPRHILRAETRCRHQGVRMDRRTTPTSHAWETLGTPGGGTFVYPVPQWTKTEQVQAATDERDPLWVRVLINALLISAVVIGLTVQARWVKRQVRKVFGR